MQSQLKKIWNKIKKFSEKRRTEKKEDVSTGDQKDFRDMWKKKEEGSDAVIELEQSSTVQPEKDIEIQMEESAVEQPEGSEARQSGNDTFAHQQEVKAVESENNQMVQFEKNIEDQPEKAADIQLEERIEDQPEKAADIQLEERIEDQPEKAADIQLEERIEDQSEKAADIQLEERIEDRSEKAADIQLEESITEQPEESIAAQLGQDTEVRLEAAEVPEDRVAKEDTEEVHERKEKKGDYKMSREALFCDGTSSYVIPPEPEKGQTIKLRFRTARGDVDTVLLVADTGIYQMERVFSRGAFDYYEISWKLGTEMFSYYFEIRCGEQVCYYNRTGVSDDIKPHYSFRIAPGFSTPDWAKGAVMYQIFVDRFYNADQENDIEDREYIYIGLPVEKVKDWNEPPQSMDVRRFYGGDLQGVMEKLDYLQDLGIEVIYFNPLFVSPSNHKYDIQDYDYIDPHIGKIVRDSKEPLPEGATDNLEAWKYQERIGAIENLEASNQLFIRLVEEIHRRGMRVILDGVFNHCGSFNKWMDRERIYEPQTDYEKGAFISKDSPYRSFFHFYNNEDHAWPYNGSYDGWWGNDTLPKLNYEGSKKLEDYIMEIGKKWVSPPYNIDGWRLDVAADLGHTNEYNHAFWKRFRKEVKGARPDALILAEHYGEPADWLQGDEWDSVMNYDAFMEPLTWFLTGMEKHSDEYRGDLLGNADHFVNTMNHFMACMLTPSLQTAMNELSNHDHSRFLTRTNHVVGRLDSMGYQAANEGINYAVMAEAVAVQMTWVGAPTVYYGDEAGVCGFTDPDSRRTYPWGKEDQRMMEFHREMIRIHKTEAPLRTGSIRMLYCEDNVLSYGRFQGDEQVVVILNNSEHLREVTVPVWLAEVPMRGRMKRLIYSYEEGFTTKRDEYIIHDGEIVVNMGRHSVLVAKTKRKKNSI